MSGSPDDVAAVAEAGGPQPVFRRILLKLSGEALMGAEPYGIDPARVAAIAREVDKVNRRGVEVALVVGAGNIYRGLAAAAEGMDRATADYAGMLATLLNCLTVQDALEKAGADTRVLSAITVSEVAEPYIRRRAIRHLEKGRIVIFAGGTGNPFFTTDTTAALRAAEIEAGAVLKGTHSGTAGIYTDDPRQNPEAELLASVTYIEVLNRGLGAMDSTAISFCMDNNLPIVVFDLMRTGNIRSILEGQPIGTLVS